MRICHIRFSGFIVPSPFPPEEGIVCVWAIERMCVRFLIRCIFCVASIDFHRCCSDLGIWGSHFDILGILGEMCSVRFSLVFEFLFCWGI